MEHLLNQMAWQTAGSLIAVAAFTLGGLPFHRALALASRSCAAALPSRRDRRGR